MTGRASGGEARAVTSRQTFRIAFFSDAHLGPLPPVRLRALANKRVTGWLNWRLMRKAHYDMAALDLLIRDMIAAAPDHVVCGGDLANLGLAEEFKAAGKFLARLGDCERVGLVPGNHDLYVRKSIAPMMSYLAGWMTGDEEMGPSFPYVRRRGRVALVGLNSATPTHAFNATGLLGERQIHATRILLHALKKRRFCRVVVIHHPPHVGGATHDRRLRDAAAFEAMLADAGAELVLHGHNHVTSVAHRPGAGAPTPIVGVGSTSEFNAARGRRPVWLRIDITADEDAFDIAIAERRLGDDGLLSTHPLDLAAR